VKGGQTISVAAPIDTIPLFVRAGSIIPLGAPIESTQQEQAIAKILVYPAPMAASRFSPMMYDLCLREGRGAITKLAWDDAKRKLTHEGPPLGAGPAAESSK